jgi:dihydroorotate dehydrogenase
MHFSKPPKDWLFSLGRAILFEMDPEQAHDLALKLMSRDPVTKLLAKKYAVPNSQVDCLSQTFANRVGLAAGLDKNGDYIDALGAMGFGHLEIGTVTPRAQAGNSKPRIFRLEQHGALINRLGFNNLGVDYLVERVQKRKYSGKLGINIGKNLVTPLDDAENDYLYCMERIYAHADYISINISSPNTQGLRDLQHGERLRSLFTALKNSQSRLATSHGKYVPLAVKIAPDMSNAELDDFCEQVLAHEIEAVIAGNTTSERAAVATHLYATEAGGLSGAPLKALANDRLKAVAERIGTKAALIGVGGISCANDAQEKLDAGATLVQFYSGLIYHGPALVRDCVLKTS